MPADRGDGGRPLAQQVVEDVNIVRGQIPGRVHVVAEWAEVRADGAEIIHRAGRLFVERAGQVLDAGIEKEYVPDHQAHVFFLRERHELPRVLPLGGQRLLAEHVLARGERVPDDFVVRGRRRRHDDGVDVRAREDPVIVLLDRHGGIGRLDPGAVGGIGLGGGDHGTALDRLEIAHVVRAPASQADYRNGDSHARSFVCLSVPRIPGAHGSTDHIKRRLPVQSGM